MSSKKPKIEILKLRTNENAEITEGKVKKVDRGKLEADIVQELIVAAFADPARFYNDRGRVLAIHEMPKAVRLAIDSIEHFDDGTIKKIKFRSKDNALHLLGKHIGMWRTVSHDS